MGRPRFADHLVSGIGEMRLVVRMLERKLAAQKFLLLRFGPIEYLGQFLGARGRVDAVQELEIASGARVLRRAQTNACTRRLSVHWALAPRRVEPYQSDAEV